MAIAPKKEVPSPEVIRAESDTFIKKKNPVPVKKGKVQKAIVDDQVIDVEVTERYPRNAQSENYRVEVVSPMTGVPMVRIAPVGWVGPAPLQVPEVRLDELIELLTKVR